MLALGSLASVCCLGGKEGRSGSAQRHPRWKNSPGSAHAPAPPPGHRFFRCTFSENYSTVAPAFSVRSLAAQQVGPVCVRERARRVRGLRGPPLGPCQRCPEGPTRRASPPAPRVYTGTQSGRSTPGLPAVNNRLFR